ncbi:MAG: hypothetical protein K6A65_02990 [Succinivibrionaceae bacterium]|nr:hypothetical protein [Succinivibrionaceae bacterium]
MSVSKRFNKDKVTVSFYIRKEAAQDASEIDLVCEHNGWQSVALKKQKNGTFRGSITLPVDEKPTYQYKFKYTFEDGSVKYDNDWDAEAYTPSPFGGDNSVFSVEAKD